MSAIRENNQLAKNNQLAETNKTATESATVINKNKMATEIQRMFRGRVNAKLRPQFLSRVCPDSAECLIIGKQRDIAHKFFEEFKTLKYLDQYKRINSGANGSIFQINFLKNGYNSYGALKIATPFDSHLVTPEIIERSFIENMSLDRLFLNEPDNMIYEYLVGLYLNQSIDYLPNFLETYQLFNITNFNTYKNIILQIHESSTVKKVDSSVLKTHMKPLKYENVLKDPTQLKYIIDDGCDVYSFGIDTLHQSYTYCLMTQFMKNPKTLRSLMLSDPNFNDNELLFVLFQIYFTLSALNGNFVHYDLHCQNVLLYQPYPDGYIEYRYHIAHRVIRFKCKYIVKIIDYGRSYMGEYTKQIKEHIENTSLPCSGIDAGESGYNIQDSYKDYFIDYDSPNVSHDLRLMSYLLLHYRFDRKKGKIIREILNKVQYNVGLKDPHSYFGTKPNRSSGYPTLINNVNDALKSLTDGVLKGVKEGLNEIPGTKKAEMNIYGLHKKYEFNEV
jgi:hypothetical protein